MQPSVEQLAYREALEMHEREQTDARFVALTMAETNLLRWAQKAIAAMPGPPELRRQSMFAFAAACVPELRGELIEFCAKLDAVWLDPEIAARYQR